MSLKLYELVGTDASRPFSPYCWRTRMALAHKGLSAESLPWRFTEKSTLAPHGSERVPVLLHHDKPVVDSWAIANYLEDNFPDRPSLFGGEGGRAMARMLNAWGDIAIVGGLSPLIIADMASYPWVVGYANQGQNIDDFPHLKRWLEVIRVRPATMRAYALAKEVNPNFGKPAIRTDEERKILFGQTASVVR